MDNYRDRVYALRERLGLIPGDYSENQLELRQFCYGPHPPAAEISGPPRMLSDVWSLMVSFASNEHERPDEIRSIPIFMAGEYSDADNNLTPAARDYLRATFSPAFSFTFDEEVDAEWKAHKNDIRRMVGLEPVAWAPSVRAEATYSEWMDWALSCPVPTTTSDPEYEMMFIPRTVRLEAEAQGQR